MIFYHGTSSSFVDSIKSQGLLPRELQINPNSNWTKYYQNESIPNMVYLTIKSYGADFHGTRTALKNNSDEYAVITVDVTEDNLYPDENLFASGVRYYKEELQQMQARVLKNKELWRSSLSLKELVSHQGAISPDKIVDIEIKNIYDSSFRGFFSHKKKCLESFDESYEHYTLLQSEGIMDKITKGKPVDFSKIVFAPHQVFYNYQSVCNIEYKKQA